MISNVSNWPTFQRVLGFCAGDSAVANVASTMVQKIKQDLSFITCAQVCVVLIGTDEPVGGGRMKLVEEEMSETFWTRPGIEYTCLPAWAC